MNPAHLRTFLAVRNHRSYTRAAEALFLSQPAVSRQIRQLEQDLGVRVFEQIGKTIHLTDAGEYLVPEAEKLLGALERTAEAVRSHGEPAQGRLRLGASTTPGLYLIPHVLSALHDRYPDLALEYAVENSAQIADMLVKNALDLGFVGAPLRNSVLQEEPVIEDEIICFSGSAHPLARQPAIAPDSLGDETWIIRERGSATRKVFETWLAAQGESVGRAIELRSPEAVKALVAAGVGIGFASVHGIEAELHQGTFVRLPVAGMQLKRTIYLVRHVDKHLSPVMNSFLALLRDAFPPA